MICTTVLILLTMRGCIFTGLSRIQDRITAPTISTSRDATRMTSQAGIRQCFEAVTTNAARVVHLENYGLEAGCDASFVLLQARDPIEAIRLRANRLRVYRRGLLVAQTAPATATLHLAGRPPSTSFQP